MPPGHPAYLPSLIHEELDRNDGQITSLFDLAYRRLGCSYWWLCQTLERMEQRGEITVLRPGPGKRSTIKKVLK
jgi:hypothetical protein